MDGGNVEERFDEMNGREQKLDRRSKGIRYGWREGREGGRKGGREGGREEEGREGKSV